MHGYGDACTTKTLGEASSPSKRWIAVTRWVECSPTGGSAVQVVLKPAHPLIPSLSADKVVFDRELDNRRGDNPLQIYVRTRWEGDHALELETVPCDDRCSLRDSVADVHISRRDSTMN
jgi:hypothetical protein